MTIVKNHKKEWIGDTLFWREQYMDKGSKVFLWRCGYMVTTQGVHYGITLSSGLLSRPNLKRLFGG